jgi:hypothetical protein
MRTFEPKDIINLVPEEYKKYKIYVYKKTTRFGTGYWVQVLDQQKTVILKRQANINFLNKYENITKEDVVEQAKEFIDKYETEMPETQKSINVGDIFYTSWGYDQTNYDYIIVLEVSPTGKTVKCQRASHQDMGYSGQSYIQKPVAHGFGDKFQLKVDRKYDGKVSLVGSYPYLGTGIGSKRYGSFSKWDGQSTFWETDTQFGH